MIKCIEILSYKKEERIEMTGVMGILFLLYGMKYFMYKMNNEKIFVKIFDFLLSIATTGFYIFCTLIFAAVYGVGRINTQIAVILAVMSFLLLMAKCIFMKTGSMKYTVIIDVFYFIILILFILAG